MTTLDSIINFLIPFILIGVALWLFRKPLGDIWGFLQRAFRSGRERYSDNSYSDPTNYIRYE